MRLRARKLMSAFVIVGTMALALPAVALAVYGSIYVNPYNHVWGKSWDASTKAAAENKALSECETHGGGVDCHGVVWIKNSCAAVSENQAETLFYYAIASSQAKARRALHHRFPSSRFITSDCANGHSKDGAMKGARITTVSRTAAIR